MLGLYIKETKRKQWEQEGLGRGWINNKDDVSIKKI